MDKIGEVGESTVDVSVMTLWTVFIINAKIITSRIIHNCTFTAIVTFHGAGDGLFQ